MPNVNKDMLPGCESPSNTESDRDPNTDELPSKPADGEESARRSKRGFVESSEGEQPEGGEGLSEEVFEVERILDHDEAKDGLYYLVRWKGYTEEEDSWEPAKNLVFATKAIALYEANRKTKPKKGRKPTSKTPKSTPKPKNETKKSSTTKSSTTKASTPKSSSATPSFSKRRGRGKSAEKSDSEPEPEIPSEDDDDDDDDDDAEEFVPKSKSSKKSAQPPPKGSGTITKAALKSYSPTTPKPTRGSTSSTVPTAAETMSAAKKALLMRQSWLYDSDSEDDSGPEKENEKNRKVEEEQEKRREEEAEKECTPPSNQRKRKAEEGSQDKKKKVKASKNDDEPEAPAISPETVAKPAENLQNGEQSSTIPSTPPLSTREQSSTIPTPPLSTPSLSTLLVVGATPGTSGDSTKAKEEVQIFAIGKVNDGRIRVVIGSDTSKKVVSLRDAHDANSWGLLQHLLQYAVFDDFDG